MIKETIQQSFNEYYWVVAEIASLQVNYSGHCYLELVQKENNKIIAKSRATIWSSQYQKISNEFELSTGESLKQGMHILSSMSVNFHEVYGLSFNIVKIDPRFTLGERARNRKEIIDRLTKEGLIGLNSELEFPSIPQSVAIISSPTAAGYEDFMNQIAHNPFGYAFSTKLYPAILQGNDAAGSIIKALMEINDELEYFDCVVIIRGGGSQIDLDCFDNYDLSVEIANFPLPILTGIGHQRDDTVIDIVSHKKLKTPTATADFLLDYFRDFEENIMGIYEEISDLTQRVVNEQNHQLSRMNNQMVRQAGAFAERKNREAILLGEKLKNSTQTLIRQNKHSLELLFEKIKQHDPQPILARGYSYATLNGNLIHKDSVIEKDQEIETHTAWHIIKSKITELKSNKNG